MDPKLLPDLISGSATLIIAIVAVVLAVITLLGGGRLRIGQFQLDFAKEAAEVRERLTGVEQRKNIGARQFALMKEYHSQGLAQAKISFNLSLVFAALGFLVIFVALLTVNTEAKLTDQGRSLLSLMAGTVVEAVASLFFVQSNRARELMVEFFDRLRDDQKDEEALTLARSIPDDDVKSRLLMSQSLHFSGVETSAELLGLLVGSKLAPVERCAGEEHQEKDA